MENLPDSQQNKTPAAGSEFIPPRHWLGMEELDAKYWADPEVQKKRGQEFYEKPVEWLEMMDKTDTQGIARRDFLTIMGASMAMASFACARRPVHKIIPYVVQPEEIVPGVPTWYASTSADCGHGCGILIRNREGRPVKLEGNPDHPLNRGALCANGQASLLNLYDPDRLKTPVARGRVANGARKEISWNEADSAIHGRLKGRVAIYSRPIHGESTRRLVSEFLGAFSSGRLVEHDPMDCSDISSGQEKSYGTAVVPQYHFDKADYVVSIGADFLAGWISPIEHSKDWAKRRKLDSKRHQNAEMSKLVSFEPIMSVTGANSDERIPIRPGDELKIALALAHEIIVQQKQSRYAGDGAVTELLGGYKPEAVAQEIAIEGGAEKIRRIAKELWAARGKGIVVAGGAQSQTKDSAALQVAVNLLNSALDNEGSTIDGTGAYRNAHGSFASVVKLVEDMKAGNIDVLVLHRVNPAYHLPASLGFAEAVKKVGLVISITDREDETAELADYVLPEHHYLENWGDYTARRGVTSLQQPAIAPIHSTRAFQDMLLAWIKGGNLRTNSLASRVALASGENTWHDYLKANWKETVLPGAGLGGGEAGWEEALRRGVVETKVGGGGARAFRTAVLAGVPRYNASNQTTVLSLYHSCNLEDGRHANNPWLQEMPDPITTVTWDNYLAISPSLAERMDLRDDDVVEVSAEGLKAELAVRIQPGMHPSTVAAALGYGRRAAGNVGNEAGTDMYPFARVAGDQLIYSGQGVNLRKTGKFYRLAATQWQNATENRPVINDITLAAFKKNPASAMPTDPHLRVEDLTTIWPVHEYKGYRWGMSIDLNSCIGCGACMIACQAENNIPVVGRDNVRVGRAMHWIKIDRYYSGKPENPEVVFEPMLCQHCENAPCETVCPVLATVHDDEGLNVQVYNRCVGTRYCQNNCPYKVRRFNFFDHWKAYQGPMNLAWNPDVTVRTRGIMEKCTFCIQRIAEAKDRAKDEDHRKLRDGELKTACQQTCPTEAIVFGDINDTTTRVAQLHADARSFRVIEDLNTRPVIRYLTKVRNKPEGAHAADSAGMEEEHGHH